MNVDEGSLGDVLEFRRKLATSFVDTDLFVELNDVLKKAFAPGGYTFDGAMQPGAAVDPVATMTSMVGMTSMAMASTLASNSNGNKGLSPAQQLYLQQCILEACNKSVIEICKVANTNSSAEKHMKRHLLMHGKEYLAIVKDNVLAPWFLEKSQGADPMGGQQQYACSRTQNKETHEVY